MLVDQGLKARTFPERIPGGIQLQHWNGNSTWNVEKMLGRTGAAGVDFSDSSSAAPAEVLAQLAEAGVAVEHADAGGGRDLLQFGGGAHARVRPGETVGDARARDARPPCIRESRRTLRSAPGKVRARDPYSCARSSSIRCMLVGTLSGAKRRDESRRGRHECLRHKASLLFFGLAGFGDL